MAYRRRRKPRVVWLPIVGNQVADIPEQEHWVNGPSGVLQVPGTGAIIFDQVPITFDYSDSASNEQGSFERSLQDLTSGNAYRLRRIVGKIHAAAAPQASIDAQWTNVELSCGFIVNRTDPSGNPLTTFTSGLEASPLSQDAGEDPWIWRRKWILSPTPWVDIGGGALPALLAAVPYGTYPTTTAGYGSVADGPHIDQKTARVISQQERLFFWIAGRSQFENTPNTTVNIAWNLDVRLLASLRMNIGNRRNASR